MIREFSKSRNVRDAITEILVFILVVLISTFILRFTWNNSLVKHVSVLKPISTFTDALLLSVSLAIIRGL